MTMPLPFYRILLVLCFLNICVGLYEMNAQIIGGWLVSFLAFTILHDEVKLKTKNIITKST